MLLVNVVDYDNDFIGLYNSDDKDAVIKSAVDDLKNAHGWDKELEFYKMDGPPWAKSKTACGILARSDEYLEDPEYVVEHEGTAWVYIDKPVFDVMIDTNNIDYDSSNHSAE